MQIWVTELAPEPRDVQWSNLSIPRYSKSVRHLLISVAVFFLVSCAATRQSTSHFHEEIDRLKNPSIDGLSAFSCSGQVDDQCSSGRVVSVYIVDYSIVGTLLVGRSLPSSKDRCRLSSTLIMLCFLLYVCSLLRMDVWALSWATGLWPFLGSKDPCRPLVSLLCIWIDYTSAATVALLIQSTACGELCMALCVNESKVVLGVSLFLALVVSRTVLSSLPTF